LESGGESCKTELFFALKKPQNEDWYAVLLWQPAKRKRDTKPPYLHMTGKALLKRDGFFHISRRLFNV